MRERPAGAETRCCSAPRPLAGIIEVVDCPYDGEAREESQVADGQTTD